ncbi:PaaI family thioesterase [Vibrio rotiferianus]|uniref:PaaI family thioesterase n=1 Tax=Vibrio rotiferianus TaxID=190895 RepID=UPI002893A62E|nr:Thioesterase [Vibrio rotiferianus]
MCETLTSHHYCAVCSKGNPYSLGVEYQTQDKSSVVASFIVNEHHQGYSGLLHGGIATCLVDGAMTHCLLANGVKALTAQLEMRFHAPIEVSEELRVTASIVKETRGIFHLVACLEVGDETRVSATAKFVRPKP